VTFQRIVVVGTTGSGKTTMAGRLAHKLNYPHIELDALSWGPDWTLWPNDEFLARVEEATRGQNWVVDGNYSRSREMVWGRADTIVWLDYPLYLIMWRLWWRTWGRWWKRTELWSGNRERLWEHFFTGDSLFLWALKTYKRRRREYPELLNRPEYAHLRTYRFHSPGQAQKWLMEIQ